MFPLTEIHGAARSLSGVGSEYSETDDAFEKYFKSKEKEEFFCHILRMGVQASYALMDEDEKNLYPLDKELFRETLKKLGQCSLKNPQRIEDYQEINENLRDAFEGLINRQNKYLKKGEKPPFYFWRLKNMIMLFITDAIQYYNERLNSLKFQFSLIRPQGVGAVSQALSLRIPMPQSLSDSETQTPCNKEQDDID